MKSNPQNPSLAAKAMVPPEAKLPCRLWSSALPLLAAVFLRSLVPASAASVSISKSVDFVGVSSRRLIEQPGHYFSTAHPTRDRGMVVVTRRGDLPPDPLHWSLLRFDSTGSLLWTQVLSNGTPQKCLEMSNGDIVLLLQRDANPKYTSLARFSRNGEMLTNGQSLRIVMNHIIPYGDGFLLWGEHSLDTGWLVSMQKLSTNFVAEWECPAPYYVTALRRSYDGALICAPTLLQNGYQLSKVDTNGVVLWDRVFQGYMGGQNTGDYLVEIVPTHDGGFLLAGYSGSVKGEAKTATPFGANDYWIVKIDRDGNKLWDRGFGGRSEEEVYSCLETENRGFLIVGWSNSEAGSGNKTSRDVGCWIVKTDSLGRKETEYVVPQAGRVLIPCGIGYAALGNLTLPGPTFETWITQFSTARRVHLSATGEPGRLYNMDVSTNLTTWRPLVIGLSGDLELKENLGEGHKFWRIYEP